MCMLSEEMPTRPAIPTREERKEPTTHVTHEQPENNIVRANRLGFEHGKQGQYKPPQWVVVKAGLWLTAYQAGHVEGQRERKHAPAPAEPTGGH